MRLTYNAPVTLTFALLATLVIVLQQFIFTGLENLFVVPGQLEKGASLSFFFQLIAHIFGHANWEHFLGNFSLILILGPILEEKYGSAKLSLMIVVTAIMTGILNLMLFDTGILGASGIVFMLILLSSITNYKKGEIPLTFVLVLILYVGKEIAQSFQEDQISQFGHVIGGLCGALFGFLIQHKTPDSPKKEQEKPKEKPEKGTTFKSFLSRAMKTDDEKDVNY
jgi:rhomboid protease GluP